MTNFGKLTTNDVLEAIQAYGLGEKDFDDWFTEAQDKDYDQAYKEGYEEGHREGYEEGTND